MGEHFFWITSRAAGVSALLASSAAVAFGLLMGARMSRNKDLRVWHEALSLGTLVALAAHAFSLLGDSYIDFTLPDLTVPLVAGYQRLWTTLGIAGGWMLAILGLSYYFRARIGPARWRKLHRFTALAWVLGLLHALGEGTDAGAAWFLIATAMVVLPAGALLIRRLTPTLVTS